MKENHIAGFIARFKIQRMMRFAINATSFQEDKQKNIEVKV